MLAQADELLKQNTMSDSLHETKININMFVLNLYINGNKKLLCEIIYDKKIDKTSNYQDNDAGA